MISDMLGLDKLKESVTENLERRTLSDGWQIPADLRIEGGRLFYDISDVSGEARDAPGMLNDFLALRQGSDEAILKYAKRWGVLNLCEHNLPIGHPDLLYLRRRSLGGTSSPFMQIVPPDERSRGLADSDAAACPGLNAVAEWSESLYAWQQHAATTLKYLAKANALHQRPSRKSKQQWLEIEDWLNDWMWLAPLQIVARFEGKKLQVRLSGDSGLFAALGAQALFAASRSGGIGNCSNCGRVFQLPKRFPPNTRTYCENCRREGAPVRDAVRDSRHKKKARELKKQGFSSMKIADQLGVEIDTVKKWLGVN